MSKKNKSNVAEVQEPATEVRPEDNAEEDSESGEFQVPLVDVPDDTLTREEIVNNAHKPKTLDKAALKALMALYVKEDERRDEALAVVKETAVKQSGIVGKIAEMVGQKAKITYKGQVLTVVGRKNKSTGETTFFFKGKTVNEDVLNLD